MEERGEAFGLVARSCQDAPSSVAVAMDHDPHMDQFLEALPLEVGLEVYVVDATLFLVAERHEVVETACQAIHALSQGFRADLRVVVFQAHGADWRPNTITSICGRCWPWRFWVLGLGLGKFDFVGLCRTGLWRSRQDAADSRDRNAREVGSCQSKEPPASQCCAWGLGGGHTDGRLSSTVGFALAHQGLFDPFFGSV